MALSEFELIDRYFLHQETNRSDVVLGVGDDAALVRVPMDHDLVLTMDSLVAGIHFLSTWPAEDIAHKALAVNLSDLAAMGAEPAWATLSLVLPQIDENWIEGFCQAFYHLAKQFNVQLIGGDLSRGPTLTITLELHGFIPTGQAITRSGAQIGDLIYVTGALGESGFALHIEKHLSLFSDTVYRSVAHRLRRPMPRLAEGRVLRGLANSMIDISDGLAADLGHILEKSGVGATVIEEKIPIASPLKQHLSYDQAWNLALFHGEDYELCFTLPLKYQERVETLFTELQTDLHLIGHIDSQQGLRCQMRNQQVMNLEPKGYQHF
jgi:thiamine-monophosphate kinase